jgi:sigma-B regulation protein RsbU (phosphoserine phosphatase)
MEEGGPVLGPLPESSYERGFVIMKPGDMLVFYTDGICETLGREQDGASEEEYGVERMLKVAREHLGRSSQEVVDAIFASVEAFSGSAPADDDRTVMVVTYPVVDKGGSKTQAFPRPVGLL